MTRWYPGAPQFEPELLDEDEPSGPPRVQWLGVLTLFAIVATAWWPWAGTAYWKSDDFLAVHYSESLGRALSDFWHSQYDLGGVVWFFRPLITMSFAIEAVFAGAFGSSVVDPVIAHASNALAHGASAALVACIAARCTPSAVAAWCAGLAWGMFASHSGSVLWAVGRVDSHTVMWLLLALLCVLRSVEGAPRMRLLSVVFTLMALCSKELAFITPVLAALLGWAHGGPGFGARLRSAIRVGWPVALVTAALIGWRYVAFGGRFGGYEGALDPEAALRGWADSTGKVLSPLPYAPGRSVDWDWLPPAVTPWIGVGVMGLALLALLCRRRFGLIVILAACYAVACAPLIQLLPHSDNLLNLRYFYLPTIALAVAAAAGGWWIALLLLATQLLSWLDLRGDFADTSRDVAAMHGRILDVAADHPGGPMLVAGLPETNPRGTALMFHVGVDRLARRPFTELEAPVYALRPLSRAADAHVLPFGDIAGVPLGTTYVFNGPDVLGRLPPERVTTLELQVEGSLSLTSKRLFALGRREAEGEELPVGDPEGSTFIRTLGHEGPIVRLTLFTAMGYLSTLMPDDDGRIDLVFDMLWARFAPSVEERWAQALRVPTTFDLSTRFPLMVEVGRMEQTVAGPQFVADAVARDFVEVEFDRGFADLIAGREPE